MRRENRLHGIKNFTVYYGYGKEDQLASYDLLVLEPKARMPQDIYALKRTGSTVVAYLSAVEVSSDDELFSALGEEDILRSKDDPLINKEYGTHYMDIASPKVQNLLLYRVEDILKSGYDGIFLDTLDDIEYLNISREKQKAMLAGAGRVAKEIRRLFADSVLVQNNGLLQVCDYTHAYIDAICFENPPYKTWGGLVWTASALARAGRLRRDFGIQLLLLHGLCANDNNVKNRISRYVLKHFAKLRGYLYYETGSHYNRI